MDIFLWLISSGMVLAVHGEQMLPLPKFPETCSEIKGLNGQDIAAVIRYGDEGCRSKNSRETVQNIHEDISLDVSIVSRTGDLFINITWTYLGSSLPETFTLYMDMYRDSGSATNSSCIVFELSKSVTTSTRVPLTVSFTCVPLSTEPDRHLVVQVFTGDLTTRVCGQRQRRAVPTPIRKCSAHRSGRAYVHVSEEHYKHQLCRCHGNLPKMTWTYMASLKKFRIHIADLPPFAKSVDVDVVDSSAEVIEEEHSLYASTLMAGGVIYSTKNYSSGTYYINLHVRCPEKQEAKTKYVADCPSDDLFVAYRNNSITIFNPTLTTTTTRNASISPAVLAGVICPFTIVVIAVVVFLTKKWIVANLRTSKSAKSDMNNSLCSDVLEVYEHHETQSSSGSPLLESNFFDKQPESSPDSESRNVDGMCVEQEPDLDYNLQTAPIHSTVSPCSRTETNRVLLLDIPNPTHEMQTRKVSELKECLQKTGLDVLTVSSAIDSETCLVDMFSDVVIVVTESVLFKILSRELYELCDRSLAPDDRVQTSPDAFLELLKKLSEEHRKLHLVSVHRCKRDGETLLAKYMEYQNIIAERDQVQTFNLHGETVYAPECRKSLRNLVGRINAQLNIIV